MTKAVIFSLIQCHAFSLYALLTIVVKMSHSLNSSVFNYNASESGNSDADEEILPQMSDRSVSIVHQRYAPRKQSGMFPETETKLNERFRDQRQRFSH